LKEIGQAEKLEYVSPGELIAGETIININGEDIVFMRWSNQKNHIFYGYKKGGNSLVFVMDNDEHHLLDGAKFFPAPVPRETTIHIERYVGELVFMGWVEPENSTTHPGRAYFKFREDIHEALDKR